ncbi:hypothetical protein HS088_TW21G00550 [Tripterygium wilfordii]|uniref:Uncharacterized protein n=1 Tax=Tripterygium wilfordii TaxID=458696 RepID=A0A7J7C2R3_TRIWF|nr:uncharacterized protein LOC119989668 [Tripterygium wilfordii]KAF5728403.1 hypothetical protein HS088_TW21G00550 [Tripterygium wilfordii]
MGNCLRRESSSSSSTTWAGEDWGSPEEFGLEEDMKVEEKVLLDSSTSSSSSSTRTRSNREVKIKITKKQLEELLGKVDIKELSVQQVLAQLMSVSDGYDAHQRSWRPALQSIPEIN